MPSFGTLESPTVIGSTSRPRGRNVTQHRGDPVSTTGSDTPATWLSQDAHDRLQAELDQLIAGRPVIAAEINARREEGDLRENGGYHAAREEQGKQEARIRYLKEFLRN